MTDNSIRVLVVDDERPIRRFLMACLGSHYTVYEAASGADALAATLSVRPDVILLDLGLPDLDGVEVTRRVREWSQIPIIVISVRDREEEKIAALDAGADDYLVKPFGAGELMARIRVVLRRTASPELEPVFQSEQLIVDLAHHDVSVGGQHVNLTPTEYDILRILIQHAGKVLTHQQLIRSVWGSEIGVESHLLRVNISNLRHKIESDPTRPRYVVTEPGVGYRLR
jgi:two-component system KDP operon response regulator KdpE